MTKRDPVERFLERVDMSGDCWPWMGYVAGRPGYGRIWFEGRMWQAHRLSYALHYGDLPADAMICHHCDNSPCVNPDHLYAGDIETNSRDAVERHRYVPKPGEANPAARLSAELVREIQSRWHAGESQRLLADEFGISTSHTNRIVHRTSWRHLEQAERRAG